MLARLLRPAAVALAAALWLTAPPPAHAELQDILNAGVVRIGVPVDVPPFGFVDDKQQPAGLDIEMAKLVAKELGVKLEMQQITGANRIPYLMTNKVDLVISAMGATPERARQVAFSSPYAALFIGLFGPADAKVGSPGEIGDKTVGVARGTTQDIELTALAPDAKIMRFDDDATAAAAYLSGQVDLLATANVTAKALVRAASRQSAGHEVHHPLLALSHRPQAGQPEPAALARHFCLLREGQRDAEQALAEVAGLAAARELPVHVADGVDTRGRRPRATASPFLFPFRIEDIHAKAFDRPYRHRPRSRGQAGRFFQYSALAARGCLGRHARSADGDQKR